MNNFWQELPRPFFILAPMEAVTDVVFRHVIAQASAPDVWYTEFTNATGWVHAGDKAIGGRLVKEDDENPIVAQIWGGDPESMAQLAAHCRDLGYHGIDINMGCPAKSAIKSGGAALIRDPELAAQAIAAAKTAGLPVSVKTRLGYTSIDEWRDWLTHLLQQDIVNLTIHLRTKKEMSKVPAHHELIPEIVKLRDEIAPHTLLTINGDIRDRAHGMELVEKYGVDGVMIGRGIFHDPFAFASAEQKPSSDFEDSAFPAAARQDQNNQLAPSGSEKSDDGLSDRGNAWILKQVQNDANVPMSSRPAGPAGSDLRGNSEGISDDGSGISDRKLLNNDWILNQVQDDTAGRFALLYLHLDLWDKYHMPNSNSQIPIAKPFDPLKRFFKIYVRDFEGAAELRDRLMHTTSTDQVREILRTL